jgi:flagellar FliL protein
VTKKIIIIAGALIALVGGGGGIYFLQPDLLPEFIRPKDAAREKQAKKHTEEKKHEPEIGADLEVFVVNLVGSGPARYFRTSLSLGVKTEKEKEEVKESSGPIRDAVITYLSERTVDELLDPQGKPKIRAALRKHINAALEKPIVTNVYFKEFLIQ